MRQTLFWVPVDSGIPLGTWELPLFGVGLLLALWMLYGVYWLWKHRQELDLAALAVPALIWAVGAFVLVKAPAWSQRSLRAEIAVRTANLSSHSSGWQAAEDHLARGGAYESLYEYQAAAEDYRKTVSLAPQYDGGYRRLAWLLATAPQSDIRDGAEAVRLARQALDIARSAKNLDALAVAYAEIGQFQDAVDAAQKAALAANYSKEPGSGEHMAEIRRRIGQFLAGQPYRQSRVADSFPRSLPVRGYGTMLFLGFVAAAWLATRLARRVGLTSEIVWDVGIWGLLAGIVGGRLFYIVQYHEKVFGGKSGFDLLVAPFLLGEGGLVLLGGLLAGSGMLIGYCLVRKISPLLMADVGVPAFFLALAFGRLGCLMNGCCYGDRCELPWAITFPMGSVPDSALVHRGFVPADATWVLPLQPSQLYSALNALVLAGVTATYFRYRQRDGSVLALGWLLYPVTRFLIEYLRGDEMGQLNTGLTISQLVSLGLFSSGLIFLIWLSFRPVQLTPWRKPPAADRIPVKTMPAGASS